MIDQQIASRLGADLFLRTPSVYDFRERDDMLFVYLSDVDSVNVTSVYETYPIGWFSIKRGTLLARTSGRSSGANLAAALFFNSDFTHADLRNANLTEAQFGANLHPAELADGEFGSVNLAYAPGHGLAR